jgi:hypothetical protein
MLPALEEMEMSHVVLRSVVSAVLMANCAQALAGTPDPGTCKLKFKADQLTTRTDPQSIVTGDFNKDGKLDFAQVNYSNGGTGTVAVWLGNGDGTFQAPVTYGVGAGPDALAVGDVNGDGKLDLVAGNDTGSSVSVLLGNGDGTFKTQQPYTAGSYPHWVALADVNGDKALDIIVANEGGNNVGVLLNNGDGTFGKMATFPTNEEPYSVAAADFNHDGNTDLAVTGYANSVVSILLGKGDGTFKNHVDYNTGTAPAVVLAYDFNRDKKIDLATADYNNGQTGSVSILLGKGDGTFGTFTDYPAGAGPDGLAVGRFNGDKLPDLAVANLIGNTMSILPGNGDGTFGAPVNFDTPEYPLGIAAGQFKSKNKNQQDLVVTDDLATTATVFLNKSKGCK